MASYREIVTKAVIGKGKKHFKNNYVVEADNTPTTILGCWVINHQFKGYKTGDKVGVDGSYDMNIWYSYDSDSKTAVLNKRIDYNDIFNMKLKDVVPSSDNDIIVRTLSQPNCVKVDITDDGKISFVIEKELGVEIVGEKKIKIEVEDDEEPWEELEEEVDDKILKEIDNEVNDDDLEEKTKTD